MATKVGYKYPLSRAYEQDNINLPSKYYSNEKYENVNYYTLKDNNPFIVYDKYFTELNFHNS